MKTYNVASVLALFLVACGGGGGGGSPSGKVCEGARTTPPALESDYAARFAGQWVGVLTTVLDGEPRTDLVGLNVWAKGTNLLETDVCKGLPALVTGLDGFDTVCFVCPAEKIDGVCDSMIITYSSGSGTLSNAGSQLDVQVSGTVDGCGHHFTLTQTLSSATRYSGLRAGEDAGAQPASLSSLALQAAAKAR